jgi:hypothetical protein
MFDRVRLLTLLVMLLSWVPAKSPLHAADPLPSWNDGPTRTAIIEFVAKVTDENSQDFVKPADRIATFDNDGTLWFP